MDKIKFSPSRKNIRIFINTELYSVYSVSTKKATVKPQLNALTFGVAI